MSILLIKHDLFDEQLPQLHLIQINFIKFKIYLCSAPFGALVGAHWVEEWVIDRVLQGDSEMRVEYQHFV